MTESHRRSFDPRHLLLLGLVLLGFFLRLFRLGAQSIWWDEAISIHLARSSVEAIISNRAGNLHPPLYFLCLKLWCRLAGDLPFSVRFLSVWFSIPLIPGLYLFARRWFGRRAGLIAAGLTTVSPLYVVYAQEARVYALLPLIYVALLALRYRLTRSGGKPGWETWALLAAVETLALGLHYVSVFVVFYVVVILLIRLRSQHRSLSHLLVVQGVVLLLSTPWLVAVIRHADALSDRLQISNWQAEPVTLVHFARFLWTFQLTGLPSLIAEPLVNGVVAVAVLALLGALLHIVFCRRSSHSVTLCLLLDWLIPLASALIIWRIRPLSHPRYVILFTPPLFLLCASVLDELTGQLSLKLAAGLFLSLSLLSATVLGLWTYFTHFTKADTRGAAAAITARSGPDDLVLVPPEDWSIPYYYHGPARVEMIWPGDDAADWRQLRAMTQAVETVFLVSYDDVSRDPRGILPFAMEAAGHLVESWESEGLYVDVYELEHPVAEPLAVPLGARFEPVCLTDVWVEQNPAADTAVAVALGWRLEGTFDERLRVSLDMEGSSGWTWATVDDWILNDSGLPTDYWSLGEEAVSYHVLPFPLGAPPLTYTLSVGVYDLAGRVAEPLDLLDEKGNPRGQSVTVGGVSLRAPADPRESAYDRPAQVAAWEEPVDVGGGVTLTGASLDRESVAAGGPFFVSLRWQAREQVEVQRTASLVLRQGDLLVSQAIVIGGQYPVNRWSVGQTVVTHRRLIVPASAADGPAEVVAQVGGREITVGQVEIVASEHIFESPPVSHPLHVSFDGVASLLGYDLAPGPYRASQPITITLYWRALEEAAAADYRVFTHVLDEDGRLVGQHDGRAVRGTRPSRSWIPGEILVDPHPISFREPYTGPASIEIGLYRLPDLERVPTEGGGNAILLPSPLTILGP